MFKHYAAILALGAMAFPSPAGTTEDAGTTACESREAVLAFLSTRYAEAPVAMGVAKNGSLIEVLTSGAGSTFTIIITRPNGTTCMVVAGQGWESLSTRAPVRPRT